MRDSVRGYGSSSYGGSTARKNFSSGYAAGKKNPKGVTIKESAGYKEGYKAGQASVKKTAAKKTAAKKTTGKLSIKENYGPRKGGIRSTEKMTVAKMNNTGGRPGPAVVPYPTDWDLAHRGGKKPAAKKTAAKRTSR